jgi:phospholipase C
MTASIDHLVLVMIENGSFDHLLGWHPTANAMQAGLFYPDELDNLHPPSFHGIAD